jgi:AraC-like DNA-binding protein
VPDGCAELIFNFGSPYELLTPDRTLGLPRAFVVRFQNKPLRFRAAGTVKVVAARLFAWGAFAVFDDDVRLFAHSVRAAGAGWDELVPELEGHVRRGRYEEAARGLQEFLIRRAVLRAYDLKHVRAAAKLLHYSKGQHRIDELADYCRLSVRQLARGFQRAAGVSPKALARALRFEQAVTRIMFDPEADLTRLAQDCGYFDQPHFIKEFKAFAGKTPTEYARQMRELGAYLKSKDVVFLQAPPPPAGI